MTGSYKSFYKDCITTAKSVHVYFHISVVLQHGKNYCKTKSSNLCIFKLSTIRGRSHLRMSLLCADHFHCDRKSIQQRCGNQLHFKNTHYFRQWNSSRFCFNYFGSASVFNDTGKRDGENKCRKPQYFTENSKNQRFPSPLI